jgi:hypothetical protein
MHLGSGRAARVMDTLEKAGVLAPDGLPTTSSSTSPSWTRCAGMRDLRETWLWRYRLERQPHDTPDTAKIEGSSADRFWDGDDDADDIAAFYAAQEVAFACLRERYEARLRSKL